jgi:small GTP-binding protein
MKRFQKKIGKVVGKLSIFLLKTDFIIYFYDKINMFIPDMYHPISLTSKIVRHEGVIIGTELRTMSKKKVRIHHSIKINTIDYHLSIIMLGSSGVGKSTIVHTYDKGVYLPQINTVGIDFVSKKLNYNDKIIKLNIYDTAGQERFDSITKSFYRKAMGAIIVCDLTDGWSTVGALNYYNELCEIAGEKIPVLLVANKLDMVISSDIKSKKQDTKEILTRVEHKTNISEISRLSENMKTEFILTSAKNNVNINSIFEIIINKVINTLQSTLFPKNIKLEENSDWKCCC